jgi:hypothetical protein
MIPDAQPVAVVSPLDTEIQQLFEAADLLQPLRPDLAETCRETACTLQEETELALWTPTALPTPS